MDGTMRAIASMSLSQRVGLFCGVLLALLVLVIHNPLGGYTTYNVPWTREDGPRPGDWSLTLLWDEIPFTEWSINQARVPILRNLTRFMIAEMGTLFPS